MLPGAPASDVRVTMQAVESGYRGHRHVRWDAGSRHHRDLVDVVHKKLWDETLVREHNGKRHASRNVDQCLANRDSRIKTFLHPESQPISKLHAVAQPMSGRKTTRSKTAPAAPKRVL